MRLTQLSRSLQGSVAVVTGAGSGMGRATAHLFADEGAKVVVVDRAGVDAVVEEITAAGYPALGVTTDVTADPGVIVEAAVAAFGGIDILVNNAGISRISSVRSPDDEFDTAWSDTLAVNLTAQARLVRRALGHLEASAAGRVVNIASTEGIVATGGLAAYTASKHGVIGLTKSLAVELGPTGITVNCVCPGPILTAMTAPIPDDAKATYAKRRVAKRRYGDPEEVAHATISLCLPAMSFCTGAVLVVDGGLTIRH